MRYLITDYYTLKEDTYDMKTFILKLQLLLILQTLDASCPKGKFGFKCQFMCGCKNDVSCNPITGSCPDGCNQKFYGPHCLLFNPFIYDPYGRLYTGTINSTESGKPCKPWSTSILKYSFKYTGSQFADKFIPGAVCRNPNVSGKNKTSPWCFINSNTLKEEKCYLSEAECPDGRFGPNCLYECHCQNLEPCDKQTGKCKQCYDGWIGSSCQIKCEVGKYGANCSETCFTCKNKVCDHETGTCLNECNAGLIGDLCNTECPDGRFGINCMYDCHCQNREPCDKHTGRCTYCHDGWIGKACQQTCEVGKYGTNCNETCLKCKANLCDHETGHCLHGCITGWEGYLCNTSYTNTSEKHSTSNLIIGSVVVGIVLVIIIIIVLTIYRWWKRKGSSTIVSDVPPEAETVFNGQSVKRVNHHSSSLRLSTSSDESVHSLISI